MSFLEDLTKAVTQGLRAGAQIIQTGIAAATKVVSNVATGIKTTASSAVSAVGNALSAALSGARNVLAGIAQGVTGLVGAMSNPMGGSNAGAGNTTSTSGGSQGDNRDDHDSDQRDSTAIDPKFLADSLQAAQNNYGFGDLSDYADNQASQTNAPYGWTPFQTDPDSAPIDPFAALRSIGEHDLDTTSPAATQSDTPVDAQDQSQFWKPWGILGLDWEIVQHVATMDGGFDPDKGLSFAIADYKRYKDEHPGNPPLWPFDPFGLMLGDPIMPTVQPMGQTQAPVIPVDEPLIPPLDTPLIEEAPPEGEEPVPPQEGGEIQPVPRSDIQTGDDALKLFLKLLAAALRGVAGGAVAQVIAEHILHQIQAAPLAELNQRVQALGGPAIKFDSDKIAGLVNVHDVQHVKPLLRSDIQQALGNDDPIVWLEEGAADATTQGHGRGLEHIWEDHNVEFQKQRGFEDATQLGDTIVHALENSNAVGTYRESDKASLVYEITDPRGQKLLVTVGIADNGFIVNSHPIEADDPRFTSF